MVIRGRKIPRWRFWLVYGIGLLAMAPAIRVRCTLNERRERRGNLMEALERKARKFLKKVKRLVEDVLFVLLIIWAESLRMKEILQKRARALQNSAVENARDLWDLLDLLFNEGRGSRQAAVEALGRFRNPTRSDFVATSVRYIALLGIAATVGVLAGIVYLAITYPAAVGRIICALASFVGTYYLYERWRDQDRA